jgi:hypothetical protein
MSLRLFHPGTDLFSRFGLDVESEVVFADYCTEMIFVYRDRIRFTTHALLIVDSPYGLDDWLDAESIQFYAWHNILSFQNVRGSTVLAQFDHSQIEPWLSSLPPLEHTLPLVHIREGNVVFFLEGVPRSVRSEGGKRRLRRWAEEIRPIVSQTYSSPCRGPVEMMIDIFTTRPAELPDVDRLSTALMDTFNGLVYEDDKQIRHLQPRVFESRSAFTQLKCRTEPMEHYELSAIPPASVYPLAMGVTDYYVVRIYPQRWPNKAL